MKTIDARSTVQSADATAGASKSRKSQSLRLEKQTIRTLTGAELHLVGGGKCDGSLGSCPIDWSFLSIL
jgi:hypothetical protein